MAGGRGSLESDTWWLRGEGVKKVENRGDVICEGLSETCSKWKKLGQIFLSVLIIF